MKDLPLFDDAHVTRERDRAMAAVGDKAERVRPRFQEQATQFVLDYLRAHGPTSGEMLTVQCRKAGIVPHDDRAFGPVYHALARRRLIVRVGQVRRVRGHGTAGGNVWAAA